MAMTKLLSEIFVTYNDFKLYMENHIDDFCYWIDESKLNEIDDSQKISAIFIEEISSNSTNGLVWTEWTSIDGGEKVQRFLRMEGMIF